MDIYLIRHGETEANKKGLFLGKRESPLTSDAARKAKKLSDLFKDIALDRVFVSPRLRAIDTAKFISESVEIVEGLSEMDFGNFEGMSHHEILRSFPEELEKMEKEAEHYTFPKGEEVAAFYKRVERSFEETVSYSEKKHYKKIAIVSHAGVIRAILSYALAGDHSLHWNFKVENGSVTKLNRHDRFYVLEYLNWWEYHGRED